MNTILSTNCWLVLCSFLSLSAFAQQDDISGIWRTYDEETGQPKSHVLIEENEDGEWEGSIISLLLPEDKGARCTKCTGKLKDESIRGMQILSGLKRVGDSEWDDGEILDPKNGKVYDCSMEVIDYNTLIVRGYIGISLLGRSQEWIRRIEK